MKKKISAAFLLIIILAFFSSCQNDIKSQNFPVNSSNPNSFNNDKSIKTGNPQSPVPKKEKAENSTLKTKKINIKKYYGIILDDEDITILTEKEQRLRFKNAGGAINYSRPVNPEEVIKQAGIKQGDFVADIGSGHGFLTFPLSGAVGKKGRVFSTDIDLPPLLYQLQMRRKLAKEQGEEGRFYENITVIYSDYRDLTLPENLLDSAIICDVHIFHYNYPEKGKQKPANLTQEELFQKIHKEQKNFTNSIHKTLKPGGTLILLEHKGKEMKLEKRYVIKLIEKSGFKLKKDLDVFDSYQFLVFERV